MAIEPEDLRNLLMRLALETGGAARMCHVQARTFRRWLAGTRDADPSAVQLLRVADAVPAARAWLLANRAGGLTD